MGNTRILRYIDLGNKMVDFVLVIFIDTPWEIWEMGNVGNMGSGKCPIHTCNSILICYMDIIKTLAHSRIVSSPHHSRTSYSILVHQLRQRTRLPTKRLNPRSWLLRDTSFIESFRNPFHLLAAFSFVTSNYKYCIKAVP